VKRKTPVYKPSPVRKRGRLYYRLWGSFGTRRQAEWSARDLIGSGYGDRYFIAEFGDGYRVWYAPHTQAMTKRDYQRFRSEE